MLISIAITDDVSIVLSHGELGFADVINSFQTADWIDIVTFNISGDDETLLKALQGLKPEQKIRFVSNVPNRRPTYFFQRFGKSPRERFLDTFGKYCDKLDHTKFKGLSALFNVENHCKIIMTDTVGYIGSSNYSSESANNFECGVLIRSKELLLEIRSEIVDYLVEMSAPRDMTEIGDAKLRFQNMVSEFKKILLSLGEGFFAPPDDMGQMKDVFRWRDAEVSIGDLEDLSAFVDQCESLHDEYDEHQRLCNLVERTDRELIARIRGIVENEEGPLHRLASFDEGKVAEQHLQKYLGRADEDNLNAFVSTAAGEAEEDRQQLIQKSKVVLIDLLKMVKELRERTNLMIEKLRELERTTWGVNNA